MQSDSISLEPRHPVRVVSERTGLSPHVLRIWERRYQAVTPARSEGGQRLYSDADIARLSLLHRASAGGRNVSQLVTLPDEALLELIAARGEGSAGAEPSGEELETLLMEGLEAVERLDGERLDGLLRNLMLAHGVAVTTEQVVVPLLTAIGERWHAGRLMPAQEHLATGVIHRALARVVHDSARGPLSRPRILVATPARERHELGAMMVAATAATCDWNVLYLGQDLPVLDIARAAELGMARVVALSVVHLVDDAELKAELRWLAGILPPQVTLVLGGAAAAGYAKAVPRVTLVGDLAALRELLRQEERLERR
jgi:DNA-binding transcriptional MerR regulator/methylmalonyl-CoA mutase cobalamin-binding subunit